MELLRCGLATGGAQGPWKTRETETYTDDMRADMSAATPATAIVVVASLWPVPPMVGRGS